MKRVCIHCGTYDKIDVKEKYGRGFYRGKIQCFCRNCGARLYQREIPTIQDKIAVVLEYAIIAAGIFAFPFYIYHISKVGWDGITAKDIMFYGSIILLMLIYISSLLPYSIIEHLHRHPKYFVNVDKSYNIILLKPDITFKLEKYSNKIKNITLSDTVKIDDGKNSCYAIISLIKDTGDSFIIGVSKINDVNVTVGNCEIKMYTYTNKFICSGHCAELL